MAWRTRGWGRAEETASTVLRLVIRAATEIVPGGVIRAGKTAYDDDAHAGFWLGVDAGGTPRFNLGNGTYYVKWTGARLEVAGGLRTRNGYVQVVDESTEDYGEGITLLQGAWLASGALRWVDGEGRAGAFVVANNNGTAGTALLIHAYPRATGAGNAAGIALHVHDKAYGEAGGGSYGISLASSGEISTTAQLRAGGAKDQVQLRVDACEDGQAADLVRAYDAAGDVAFAVAPDGSVTIAGSQVLAAQQAAIADLSEAGSDSDGLARAAINDILAALRAHGLIGS